jgi:hypothetical protein
MAQTKMAGLTKPRKTSDFHLRAVAEETVDAIIRAGTQKPSKGDADRLNKLNALRAQHRQKRGDMPSFLRCQARGLAMLQIRTLQEHIVMLYAEEHGEEQAVKLKDLYELQENAEGRLLDRLESTRNPKRARKRR